jgi:hypothetical protein
MQIQTYRLAKLPKRSTSHEQTLLRPASVFTSFASKANGTKLGNLPLHQESNPNIQSGPPFVSLATYLLRRDQHDRRLASATINGYLLCTLRGAALCLVSGIQPRFFVDFVDLMGPYGALSLTVKGSLTPSWPVLARTLTPRFVSAENSGNQGPVPWPGETSLKCRCPSETAGRVNSYRTAWPSKPEGVRHDTATTPRRSARGRHGVSADVADCSGSADPRIKRPSAIVRPTNTLH